MGFIRKFFHFMPNDTDDSVILQNGVLSENEFLAALEKERERTNRNKHQFSLILVDLGKTSAEEPNGTREIISKIHIRLRRVDEIRRFRERWRHANARRPTLGNFGVRALD